MTRESRPKVTRAAHSRVLHADPTVPDTTHTGQKSDASRVAAVPDVGGRG